ncbi:MAG TPA: hypothetical protein VK781_13270 [Solirubrobacteraceae bacterium]|nr:hypothetical protein [Solirubrobacteraceae bacterium]
MIVVRAIRLSGLILCIAAALAVVGVSAESASAEALAPWWGLTSGARPTSLTSGEQGQIVVTAQNLGDAPAQGETEGKPTPVTIVDQLPPGLKATQIKGIAGQNAVQGNRGPVLCVLKTLTCTFSESLPPYEQIEVVITVQVQEEASTGELNTATVSGGGAVQAVSASHPLQIDEGESFGIEDYALTPEEPGGSLDLQAGSHPFQLTSVVTPNSQRADSQGLPRSAGLSKDIVSELPRGLFGNPTPFVQCTDAQFAKMELVNAKAFVNECPSQSAVGVATITFNEPKNTKFETLVTPIFIMKPRVGEPARFGFSVGGIFPVFLDATVRTGGDYGVTIASSDITEVAWLLDAKLTFWGVPGDPRHDNQRGWDCLEELGSCSSSKETSPPPFLVLPSSCAEPFHTTLSADSWNSTERPAEQATPVSYQLPEALQGCNHLPFSPSLSVAPDIPDASSPTGLTVGVHLPQEAALNPEGLAESSLKDTTVVLPQGVSLNPAGADGLEACSEAQIGFLGAEPGSEAADLFTPGLPEPFCPDASKVGTVKIKTPLLPNPLEGAVYLAEQDQNPFGSLVAMYLVAQDPISGTLLKLPGEVVPDPVTGQLISTFQNTPELPFEDLELHFFGGERAPLSTPSACGTYTTRAVFAPWSGNAPAEPSSAFGVTSGPNGSPCASPLPFAPSLTAGTTSIQAGGFSPFTTTMSREDGNQSLQAISLHMPPGLSGILAGVQLCPEPQADQGLCGPDSQIGETTVSVGLGGDPFSVKGGRVYITGPYEGAPYGLSIVNPAKAGPFDLEKGSPCDCVVVRARIEVDPITAALTITTDDSGPFKIPTILQGIPLQIKHVNVLVNRPGFTFNPTSCDPLSITGSLSSTEGAVSNLSVPLQVTNCAVLGFKPAFSVSTNGRTSRAKGASLHVKLAYPKAPFGSQANIKSVKVDLPKLLPSNLKTLQQACPDQTFERNPASCSVGSRIGEAKATTPLLPVPLAGPVYFVSHGGAKFPELVVVLSGYGTTVQLHAETFISKAGITSSTFRTIPDVPVGTFELTLPQGRFSALSAPRSLCNSPLKMPTVFTAQNGAVIKQNTPIAVTGCPKHKVGSKGRKTAQRKAKRRKAGK